MAANESNLTIQAPTVASIRTRAEIHVPRAYVETTNGDPSSMDVLCQFQANLTTLEDLSGRLHFMITEIRGLIKR